MSVLNEDQTVGARLRVVRKKLGLSQEEMAQRLSMSTRGWQKIERDEALPNGETLLRFKSLNINPGWILSGLGPTRIDEESFLDRLRAAGPVVGFGEDEVYDYAFARRVDPELFGRIWDLARRVHENASLHFPRKLEVQAAAIYYNEFLEEKINPHDERAVGAWLSSLEARLVSEIEEAKDDPGSGKLSGSL